MRSVRVLVPLVLTVILGVPGFGQGRPKSINEFAWMAGCWENDRPAHKFYSTEQWMSPRGDAMLGMSRTVKGDKMSEFEFLRIVQVGVDFFYIAHPEDATISAKDREEKERREKKDRQALGKPQKDADDDEWETPFKLIKWDKNEVTFENKEHDFPQRIIYKLTAPDTLVATIEGEIRDRLQQTEYPMKRVSCP